MVYVRRVRSMRAMKTRRARGLNKKQKTAVKRLMSRGKEKKYIDTSINQATGSSAVIGAIQPPPQGSTDSQRVGDSIMINRIIFTFNMFKPQNLNTGGNAIYVPNVGRMILFQWKNQSAPADVSILPSPSSAFRVHTDYTWDYENQVSILYDRRFSFDPNGKASQLVHKTIYGKKLIKKIQFVNGGVGGNNLVYYMFLSDNGATDTNQVQFYGRCRIVYTDA